MDSNEPLFRRQVTSQRLTGTLERSVIPRHNNHAMWLGWTLVVLTMAILALLIVFKFRVTEAARGILVSTSVVERIAPERAATIEKILVREGDHVLAGEVLVTLSNRKFDGIGQPVELATLEGLERNQHLLEAESQLLTREHDLAISKLNRERQQSLESTRLLRAEREVVERQISLLAGGVAAMSRLRASAAIGKLELDNQRLRLLQVSQQRQALLLQEQQLLAQREGFEEESSLQRLRLGNARLALAKRQEQVKLQRSELLAASAASLVAPRSGVVTTIALDEGQLARGGQTILFLRDSDTAVEADLFVPARIATRLRNQQQVLLRLDAFDYRQFGRFEARVTNISMTPIDAREYLIPIETREQSLFRVTATLEPEQGKSAEGLNLQPGSTLTADFVFEEKTLLSYVLQPLMRLRGKIL